MSTNRAIPAAHTKLRRLCAEAAARRGTLITFAKVAEILGLSRGRITQMFGIQSPSAEGGLAPATLGRLVEAFRAEAVPVTIDLMQSPLDTFEAAFAPPSTPPPSAAPRPVPDDPPSPDWLPGHAETFTGEPDAPETALAALAVHPAVPENFRGPDCYSLPVYVGFQPVERAVGNHSIEIGLSQATLAFSSRAYQIAEGTLLGSANSPLPGAIASSVNTITLIAPPEADRLEGNPLDGRRLGVIEPLANPADPVLTLTLTASPRAFTFRLLDGAAPDPSPTKSALMALVYGESLSRHRSEKTGRVTLARATMRRKP